MSNFHDGPVHIHHVQGQTLIEEIKKEEERQEGPIELGKVPGPLLERLVAISEPGFHIGMWANKVVFAVQITYVYSVERTSSEPC